MDDPIWDRSVIGPNSVTLLDMKTLTYYSLMACLIGCSCGSEPMGGACLIDDDCEAGFTCTDLVCTAVPDGTTSDADSPDGPPLGDSSLADGDLETDGGPEDASCGGENVAFDYRPPNVLLIFDRSCSMRRRLDASGFGTGPDDARTRWAVGRDAVLELVTRFGGRVFWGLMMYPDPREGCPGEVSAEVLPAPGTAAEIERQFGRMNIQPFGLCGLDNSDTTTQPRQTPTSRALEAAATLPELMDPMRDNFAIVITDGGESCVENDALSTITSGLVASGVPVGVIGFATGSDVSSLEAIASAGGLARPGGAPSYYVAEDRADLDTVFEEISRRVVSCELALSSRPPEPSELFVNEDDVPLSMDPVDGWSYDEAGNTLTFNGASCDRLRSGETTRISVSFGCAPVECTPREEICNGLDEDCDDMVDEGCLL